PLVQHGVQTSRFADIAIDRVGQFFRRIETEVVVLSRHWPQTAHLPEQPLQRLVPATQIGRQELAGLFRQIQQDRPGFEHGNGFVLPRKWPQTANLKEQAEMCAGRATGTGRQRLARLFRSITQDINITEQKEGSATAREEMMDNRRTPVIVSEFKKIGIGLYS